MARIVKRREPLLEDLLRGAVAGAAATWLMGQVTSFLYQREDQAARDAEEEARGGKSAYGVAAEKAAALAGRELTDEQRKTAGSAVHWSLGALAGAAYGGMRGRVPAVDAAEGLLFGTGFWLLVDEGANVALGLTPGPSRFPWQTHARGLAGHLVFGVATHTALRALDRLDGD